MIADNRLYINCSKALYCIDLLSGTVVWSRDFPSAWGSDIRYNSLKEYGNTILLVSDHTNIAMAISKTDGSTVWENKEVGCSADELTLFEGILYYTSTATGRLYAIDAATGKTIWNMGSPNRTGKIPASFSFQSLCIDPIARRLFVTDTYFILCVELPEG
ncbi:MAG: PQQ-like beta-propeller repeat protein [Lewinellaceae bacterium]|nr:PQQ-like beta-propeller repeat protein [Lewinellaceae bacterium]